MEKTTNAKLNIIVSMLIWGSIGVFVREITLSSIEIAFLRAFIGSMFLIIVILLKRIKLDKKLLKKNIVFLILSGMALAANWFLLFEAMKYTTISNAILSYYFAPIFIVLFSAILFKEKITFKNIFYLLISITGLFIIMKSDGLEVGNGFNHIKGILYGLSGAIVYAIIVILNKYIKGLSGVHTTVLQLLIASISLTPFIFKNSGYKFLALNNKMWFFILTLGIVHTGVAYLLYFSAIKNVKGKSIAILSYLDPIVAVLTAFIFLQESMNKFQIFGALLILVSSYLSEITSEN
ncbi:MAG: EamA family transporter [Clostridium sp.]|nr:EamA family transporter [Clostridium sp.]